MASSNKNSRLTRNGSKVAPAPNTTDDILEIRPGRKMRIRHLNPKKRDEKFAKEMEVYLRARQTGLIDSVFMPPKRTQGSKATKTTTDVGKSTVSLNYSVGIESEIYKEETPEGNTDNKDKFQDLNAQVSDDNMPITSLSDDILKENVASDIDKSNNKFEMKQNSADGWVSKAVTRQQASLTSPSRISDLSPDRIQSSSGVLVSMSRPTSETVPMNIHSEAQIKKPIEVINLADRQTGSDSPRAESVKSARTPRKTKDHRPISAKNIQGAKSIASTEVSDDLIADLSDFDSPVKHKSSSFKDVTLFFIHGVGGSADIWNAQLNFFTSLGVEVIAPDLLGHGYSSSPNRAKDYLFNEILADMEAVFDKYCKRQNIVIAHSYGCAFAAVLGRRRARRVSKLVLISGGAPTPLAPQGNVFSLPLCCLSCLKPCVFSSFERDAFHSKTGDYSKEVAFDIPPYVLKYMMQGQYWPDGDELYHRWLSMPTLLIHGKYDKFVTVEEEIEMSRAIYYSHLEVVDNAGHMVMMEAPKHVNQLLYDFVFQELSVLKELKDSDGEPPITSRIGEGTTIHAR